MREKLKEFEEINKKYERKEEEFEMMKKREMVCGNNNNSNNNSSNSKMNRNISLKKNSTSLYTHHSN